MAAITDCLSEVAEKLDALATELGEGEMDPEELAQWARASAKAIREVLASS